MFIKEFLLKERQGNIFLNKLPLLFLIIMIAVTVFSMKYYFFSKWFVHSYKMDILNGSFLSKEELKKMGFCSGSKYIQFNYDPVRNIYTLKCDVKLGKSFKDLEGNIHILEGCDKDDTLCKYQINY